MCLSVIAHDNIQTPKKSESSSMDNVLSAQTNINSVSGVVQEPILYPLDGILAILYHPEGTEIILLSDLRPTLDGPDEPRTLRQAIVERLMVLDAKMLKVLITEDEVDRFIGQIQKQHNLTRIGMERLFNSRGYTYDEGRQQLLYKQYIEHAIEWRVKTNKKLIIQRPEVEEFYRKNPDIEPARYTLKMGFVAQEDAETREKLDALLALSDRDSYIAWDEQFDVLESELPEDRQYVIHEPVGTVVAIEPIDDGWQITQLIEKIPVRELPLSDERYEEIAFSLMRERGQALLNSYEDDLLSKATIRLTNPRIKLTRE